MSEENGDRVRKTYPINGYEANQTLPKMLDAYVRVEKNPKDRNDAIRTVLRNTSNRQSVSIGAKLGNIKCPEDNKKNVWQSYDEEMQAYSEQKRKEREEKTKATKKDDD